MGVYVSIWGVWRYMSVYEGIWSETMFLVNPTKAFGRFAPSAIVGLLRNSLSEAFRVYVSGLCFGTVLWASVSGL